MVAILAATTTLTAQARPAHGCLDSLSMIRHRQGPLAAQVSAVADRAGAAYPAWAALGPNARRATLNKAASALEARREDFVKAMMDELGATAGWADFNLMLAASMTREEASLTTQIGGELIPSDKPGCLSLALREPVAVVLGIAPWNAPVTTFKASENCPRTHELIIEALADAGFPPGVVNVVTNASKDAARVVGALIDHAAVRRVNFTGATAVGKLIAKRCAEHLKPCLAELGGKAPLLVLEYADLDEAVKASAFGAFVNQGQICMSTERIIVAGAVADEFARRFAAKVATLTAGDPCVGKKPLGAAADRCAVQHVNDLIVDATSNGALILTGRVARQRADARHSGRRRDLRDEAVSRRELWVGCGAH
jgi:benzaldehyde dehydrogenase (NAD)